MKRLLSSHSIQRLCFGTKGLACCSSGCSSSGSSHYLGSGFRGIHLLSKASAAGPSASWGKQALEDQLAARAVARAQASKTKVLPPCCYLRHTYHAQAHHELACSIAGASPCSNSSSSTSWGVSDPSLNPSTSSSLLGQAAAAAQVDDKISHLVIRLCDLLHTCSCPEARPASSPHAAACLQLPSCRPHIDRMLEPLLSGCGIWAPPRPPSSNQSRLRRVNERCVGGALENIKWLGYQGQAWLMCVTYQ